MLAPIANLLLFFAISTSVVAAKHCATLYWDKRGQGYEYRITPSCINTVGYNPDNGKCIEETNFEGSTVYTESSWNNKVSSFTVEKDCTLKLWADYDEQASWGSIIMASNKIGEWNGNDSWTYELPFFGTMFTAYLHDAKWINLPASGNNKASKFYCECPADRRRHLEETGDDSSDDVSKARVLVHGLVGGLEAEFEVDVPGQTTCNRDMCRLVKSEVPDVCDLKTLHPCTFSCCAEEVEKMIGNVE